MPFAPEEVRRLARAARLDVDEASERALARDLDRILEAFGTLPPAGDGADARPAAPPRPDEAAAPDPELRERILSQVPRRSGDLVRVPRRGA